MKALIYVPVFNQVRELPRVLSELDEVDLTDVTILLVNNGSSDGSQDLVRKSRFDHLDIDRNRGIGYGFIKSVEWALERDFDAYGSMAANAKMLPAELPRILQPLADGRADYVTGSRFMEGGAFPNLPRFRRWSIPMVNAFVRVVTGARLTDATCGYRAYTLDVFRRARFDWRAEWLYTYGFEYYVYAEVLCSKAFRWCEVPVTMRYPEAGRYSKIRPGLDWWAMLKPYLRARLCGKGFTT